ncbi:MAG: A24 family peptidase [Candidatus Omnitrophota bacterium]
MRPEIVTAAGVLALAAYIDWKEHRVPNWLTFAACGFGLAYHALIGGVDGLESALLGAAAGLATLIVPYALKGMGAGDVKLMAAVGAWVGAEITLHAFLWIAVCGGLMGAWSILRSREVKERLRNAVLAGKNLVTLNDLDAGAQKAPAKILLPYGVPIAFGFYAYFLFGGLI